MIRFWKGNREAGREEKTYSYIKLPFSKEGWYSFLLALLALLITAVIVIRAIRGNGTSGVTEAVLGVWCIFASLISVWFGSLGFRKKDKNNALALAGSLISLVLLAVWVLMIGKGNAWKG